MKEILTNYVVPLGVVLTFFASICTIYITRVNARSSKYIDTITSERINWIEKIRLEIADINAVFLTIIKNSHFLTQLEHSDNLEDQIQTFATIASQRAALQNEITDFPKTDILRKINTVKLRLNLVEDVAMLGILDDLLVFILGKERTAENVTKAWDQNNELLRLTQEMLKREWEKIKKEARE